MTSYAVLYKIPCLGCRAVCYVDTDGNGTAGTRCDACGFIPITRKLAQAHLASKNKGQRRRVWDVLMDMDAHAENGTGADS